MPDIRLYSTGSPWPQAKVQIARGPMKIEKFRAMISSPEMTKQELKQVLQNVAKTDAELADEVKVILTKRFPTWANIPARRGKKA